MSLRLFAFVMAALLCLHPAYASQLVGVHGVVHDPQHRPIVGATVTLHAANADLVVSEKTNSSGEFNLAAVPLGVY